jgi:hypothetical protein
MKLKSLWVSGMFAMAALAQSSGPAYNLWFNSPMMVSSLELPAGPYSVSRDGAGVVFKNQSTGDVFMVRAQVEHLAQTNRTMKMEVATKNGQPTLQALELPGEAEDLVFGG